MAFADLTHPVYEAIRAYLAGAWTLTPLAFPNEDFAKPATAAPFVAVEFTGTLYGQQSIGASAQADNRWDEEGMLWLHVMALTGAGSSAALGGARQLADLFRGLTLLSGSLEFLDAVIGLGEPGDDDGNYFRVSVSIEWRRIDA